MTEIRRPLHIADNNVEELNRVLMYIQDRLDEIEGRRGTPTFKANINLDGNKITNASQGTASGEMLTADLESTDLELSGGNLRVKVSEEQGLKRTITGLGIRTDATRALMIDGTEGLQAMVKSLGGIAIDESNGLYADAPNIDHGSLGGLTDDDHAQYLNTTRHDLNTRHTDAVVCQAQWTDYSGTSTITGWTSYNYCEIYYKKIGKTVIVNVAIDGVSNSATTSFTLPYTAATYPTWNICALKVQDNSALVAGGGVGQLAGGASTVTCYSDWVGNTWTAINNKSIFGTLVYEASS